VSDVRRRGSGVVQKSASIEASSKGAKVRREGSKRNKSKEDLYLSMGIDCVVLNYRKPESYMELLKRIESLVNKNIKHK